MISSHKGLLAAGVAALAVLSVPQAARAQNQTTDMTVTATAVAACILSVEDLDFGAYVIGQTGPNNAETAIFYDCAPDLAIRVELGLGINGDLTNNTRNMSNNGSLLSYNLYQDPTRSNVWATGNDAVVVDPTSDLQSELTVYGQIPAGQTPLEGQLYQDTVLVTLTIEG